MRGNGEGEGKGILGRRQRFLAWAGLILLALYAPVLAWLRGGDTWEFSVAVAALVGYVITVDDILRRRRATAARQDVDAAGPIGEREADE